MKHKRNMFSSLFKKKPPAGVDTAGYFTMLNGYTPVYTSAPGSVYEMELTRAAIHQFANFCSKLKPEMTGSAMRHLEHVIQMRPNPYMDTSKFLYRLATILEVEGTAFILPLEDERGVLCGYYPARPALCEIVEWQGTAYLRCAFSSGERYAIELDRVGILTKFAYNDDLFGTDNAALRPTMELMSMQNQGIINNVKNSASIRFLAKISNIVNPKLVEEKRKQFAEANLGVKNSTGLMVYDNTFTEIKPIDSKPLFVSPAQIEMINDNVYRYFNTNQKILTNSFDENDWNAYYEGKVEPFALQTSLVMSNMTFTQREIAHDNSIFFSANRLQYASNQSKLQVSSQLFDRGLMNRNSVMDIWNLPHVEGGEKYYIRKEYAEVSKLGEEDSGNADS